MTTREAFEAWLNPGRHAGNVSQWVKPGRYEKETHQLAWLAWKATTDAALASAPSWHDAPTCAGLWHVKTHPRSHPTVIAEVFVSDVNAVPTHCRWYGPIPEDRQ